MYDFSDATGFIFDCDGTLLDTLDAWRDAEADLVEEAGNPPEDEMDVIHAAPFEEAARLFHERFGVGESTKAVFDHLEGHLMHYYRDVAEPLPGVVDFVGKLTDAGIPLVVLSSSPTRYIQAGLARANLTDCFRKIITTDDTGFSKQDPRIYQYALDVLESPLATTWAVDDAPYAVKVMHDFGLHTIAPVNDATPERVARYGKNATIVVPTLAELV